MDLSDLSPDVRAAAYRASQASASEVGSDRFREQLRIEFQNSGLGDLPPDVLNVLEAAIRDGTLRPY